MLQANGMHASNVHYIKVVGDARSGSSSLLALQRLTTAYTKW